MTRAPGASYAQFFPAAPRVVARDRTRDREDREGPKGSTLDSSPLPDDTTNGHLTSLGPAESCPPQQDGHIPPSAMAGTRFSSSQLTPPASNDSPSSHLSSAAQQPSTTVRNTNGYHGHVPIQNEPLQNGTSSVLPSVPERTYARDPSRPIQTVVCTYDPLMDKKLPSGERMKTKPKYKEFGLDGQDDAPPQDPRLAKGGRLGYINVDFHHAKARLRQTPYSLKQYKYDPRTSCGPGPPTQIVVTGFNPITPFSTVTTCFAAFGDIAESSNKLHPDNGSYLGFATFRYKDTKPNRSRPQVISAADAARNAVRAMNNKQIAGRLVRVDFDPDGKKSSEMLVQAIRKDSERHNSVPSTARPIPTGPRASVPGPPPTAPRGPAAHRAPPPPPPIAGRGAGAGPVPVPGPPSTRPVYVIETESVKDTIREAPFIFVAHEYVPVQPSTVMHMRKRLKVYAIETIRADKSGYYVIFHNSDRGRHDVERCYRACNRTPFFNYLMVMELNTYGSEGRGSRTSREPRRHSRSPERRRVDDHRSHRDHDRGRRDEDRQKREEQDRRKREEESLLKEEKDQRAKNFDPVIEATNVVIQQMKEQLIRHIRTKIAAPALLNFLDPANQVASRRKHNIEDPHSSKLSITFDDSDTKSPVGTPNSRADPIERRTGRLDVSALPRIRKAKNAALNARKHAFNDPFARHRPPTQRSTFRSLHDRLQSDSDDDSDDEVDHRYLNVRNTDEPESRPRSRSSTDDEATKEDYASWGPAEEDSMTEASFALTDGPALPRKRKLDLQMETAIKRQKKTDEELFGVTINRVDPGYPSRELSPEDIVLPDAEHLEERDTDSSRMPTPVPQGAKSKKKATKTKKKSKKQIFEEREALKRQQEEIFEKEASLAADEVEPTPDAEPEPGIKEAALDEEPDVEKGEKPRKLDLDEKMYPSEKVRAFELPSNFILNETSLRASVLPALSHADLPNLERLKQRQGSGHLEQPQVWAWMRDRVRELNSPDGSKDTPCSIGGYYVPNTTGCARTEGVKKILNSEKSKYLPHHIKVQKAREERQAQNGKSGKDSVLAAAEAAKLAAESQVARGTSRANRANNRRFVAGLHDQIRGLGQDSDAFRFNQLKKRKKPVKFARSAIHNWGLYTMENIPKDDMIIEYVGEEVRQVIAELREARYLKSGIGSSYLFRIDDNTVIDATKKGGIARFINHSCMPNCTAKIIKVEGSKRIVIYALRDIAQNEELTYDYKFEREIGATDRIPCLCGTAACKGFLN
ncbi:Putative histone-lysine N-methyltransferase, H3 lysine-4 specific [Podospora comata]|uniref:Histone-lysine N-methyltransferase, H3 lysine-4 specific n=1 Tax=Podospora comata TaxID=48703 RepID=A0ABY6S2Z7_PODCO|nr:Putative histone-lysine N-methyltransferase, H3 lysine-4 specific [Podospora comata]